MGRKKIFDWWELLKVDGIIIKWGDVEYAPDGDEVGVAVFKNRNFWFEDTKRSGNWETMLKRIGRMIDKENRQVRENRKLVKEGKAKKRYDD